jgi:hypothetical protein
MTGSKQQITNGQIYSPAVTFQNNGTLSMRIGDNTVTSARGILLFATGSFTISSSDNRIPLFSFFVVGTAGDTMDILYI